MSSNALAMSSGDRPLADLLLQSDPDGYLIRLQEKIGERPVA